MIFKRIGIDFHGVINYNPLFFRHFNKVVALNGLEIHIVSGGPREYISQYLQENRILYHHLWCILDKYVPLGVVTYFDNGKFHMDDELWNTAKGKYCAENDIAIMIDDSKIYGQSFVTPYCLYDNKKQLGYINNRAIDFNQSPQQVFTSLCEALT